MVSVTCSQHVACSRPLEGCWLHHHRRRTRYHAFDATWVNTLGLRLKWINCQLSQCRLGPIHYSPSPLDFLCFFFGGAAI
ncbi:uncharacterized protein EI90DRAFT_1476775 [Cantharellus anzutake]|uniref:uncharacterized protein n=1 Tax=Cantharellus anzutake TaxID=1750568 RepID=UPI001908E618|nr:uncharacterized protein EI90DRAFT_1476775 [Cantharellus anzutake]KAF8328784.1 hypothetical protein EI90DRAFT_1476775 [Cantharellus anzutake]